MKRTVSSAAVLALALAGSGVGQAASGFKVTGGGQTLIESDANGAGPGTTYGFNAQQVAGGAPDAAKGQFNTIQRDEQTGPGRGNGEHIKGEVNCLIPVSGGEDGAARFGGIVRGTESDTAGGDPNPLLFIVDVTDNGEGNNAEQDDTILYREIRQQDLSGDDENACDVEPENNERIVLARGNVQIHN